MKWKEIVDGLELEEQHFQLKRLKAPIIQPEIYPTLGKRLYELYRRYNISERDQREFEKLSFCLLSFLLRREEESKETWMKSLKRRLFSEG